MTEDHKTFQVILNVRMRSLSATLLDAQRTVATVLKNSRNLHWGRSVDSFQVRPWRVVTTPRDRREPGIDLYSK